MMRALITLCCICLGSASLAQTPNAKSPAKKSIVKPKRLKLPQVNTKLGNKLGKTLRGKRRNLKEADASSLPPVTGKGGMIAKVNGVSIPLAQFKTQYDRFAESFKARKRPMPLRLAERYRKTIVKRLVNEELVRQEATRLKVTPSEADLAEELKNFVFGLTD